MSIFIPYNIESRKQKHKQAILKLLQSEVIEDCLELDDNFYFKEDQVKVRLIKNHVYLISYLGYIPEWLKNVRIEGSLNLSYCKLTSLKNCPQYIGGSFFCIDNNITDYTQGPKYVGGNYYIRNNINNELKQQILDTTDIVGYIK